MMKLKNYFSDWNLYEKLYLLIGVLTTIIVSIVTKSSIISMLYVVSYTIEALLYTKGKVESYIFGFIGIIFYSYLSYGQRYFGELIIIIFITLPLLVMGVINWLNNKTEESVIISTLSKKEIAIVLVSQLIMFWIYYYILKLFNTNMLVTSTLSIVFSSLALYFGARRSEIAFYFYLLNDIIIIMLWVQPILNGQHAVFSAILSPIILFINDIYGTYNWRRLKKEQKETN